MSTVAWSRKEQPWGLCSLAAVLRLSLAQRSLHFADPLFSGQLLQHLKRIISDLCKLYNLPQHPDVEMLDQPLPAEQVSGSGKGFQSSENRFSDGYSGDFLGLPEEEHSGLDSCLG